MKKDLHCIALSIYQLCLEHRIGLEVEWIQCTEIERADFISDLIDIEDRQITSVCIDTLQRAWNAHTVDCFGNYFTTKTARFFSWHWNPGCAEVDFFVQNLTGESCLVVPPATLITRALHYLHKQKALAQVVAPYWLSYFWPFISKHLARFVVDYKVFRGTEALTHGRNTCTSRFRQAPWRHIGSQDEILLDNLHVSSHTAKTEGVPAIND